jgi:MCP family monocarboxylic acid transporter-like MFS transporter 10
MNDKDSEGNNDNLYTSCIGSFAVGMTFFCSFVASSLTRVIGIRKTAVLGGTLATCGLFAASFATSFLHIWLSYGVLFGVGASLSYTPSLVILGHYFDSRLGIVNGVVTAGSSIFSVLLSITLNSLVKTCSYREVMWILTGFMSLLILCGMTFIERSKCSDPRGGVAKDGGRSSDRGDKDHKGDDESISSSVWSNTLYLIWITGIPIGLFGYFVPYFTLVNYFKLMVPQVTPSLPITTMSVASGVGRILFGLIADLKGVNRILLQQIAFVSIGLLTFSLTCASNVYVFMVICLGLGLFDGCFITVLGPIAFDLVGREAAPQAVGFLLALCSLPLTVGPMVAGSIIDSTGSFAYAFFYAGIPPLIGAVIMIPVLLRSGRRGKSMNHEDHRHDSCSSNSSSLLQVIDEEDGRKRKGRTVVPSTQTSVTEIPGTPAEEDDLERGGNNLTVKNNNFFLTGNFTSSTCSDGDDDDQDDDGDQSRGVDHFLVDNNNKKSRDLL